MIYWRNIANFLHADDIDDAKKMILKPMDDTPPSERPHNDGHDVQVMEKNGDTDPNVDDLLRKVVKISLMYLTDANGMLRIDFPLTLPVYDAILYLVKVGKAEIINCGDNRIFVKQI